VAENIKLEEAHNAHLPILKYDGKSKGGKALKISFEGDELLEFDLGIIDHSLYDQNMISPESVKELISQKGLPEGYFYFSQWINKHYGLIMKQDVKEKLEHQIAFQSKAINRCKNETAQLQRQRVSLFQTALWSSLNMERGTYIIFEALLGSNFLTVLW